MARVRERGRPESDAVTDLAGRRSILLLDGDHPHAATAAGEIVRATDLNAILGTARRHPFRWGVHASRRITTTRIDVRASTFEERLLEIVERERPVGVIPIGFRSTAALSRARERVPCGVRLSIPDAEAIETALDKRRTLALAARLGIPVPRECRVDPEREGPTEAGVGGLAFPLFLKAARETGGNVTALAGNAEEFAEAYERVRARSPRGEVLIQEYVEGDGATYGVGAFFCEGRPIQLFGHRELRSVPRTGGSGTRVQIHREPALEAQAVALLRELEWHGVALVEFRRRSDDAFVLMEINPKFWASYALASRFGHRFAAAVAEYCESGMAQPRNAVARQRGELAFPSRELMFVLRNWPRESFTRAFASLLWPPVRWNRSPAGVLADFADLGVRAVRCGVSRLVRAGGESGESGER